MLWTLEYRDTVPHNVGSIYSGLTVIGIGVKEKLLWKCNHY